MLNITHCHNSCKNQVATQKTAPPYRRCCFNGGSLVPAEGLAQNPDCHRNRDKEQTQTNWAAPAKPRAPCAPVLHTGFVIAHLLLVVLHAFTFVCHAIPLLVTGNLSPEGFDDAHSSADQLIPWGDFCVRPCRSPNE
jgi:hypothetical protein